MITVKNAFLLIKVKTFYIYGLKYLYLISIKSSADGRSELILLSRVNSYE